MAAVVAAASDVENETSCREERFPTSREMKAVGQSGSLGSSASYVLSMT